MGWQPPASVHITSDGKPFGLRVTGPGGEDLTGTVRAFRYEAAGSQPTKLVVEFLLPRADIKSPPLIAMVTYTDLEGNEVQPG